MSRTFLIEKIPIDCESALFVNQVTIIPGEDQIIFTDNTRHCYKGLISFFKIALKTAVDERGVRPIFIIIENDEKNILTIQGDSEYVILMCAGINLFDEKSADDMLSYLRSSNQTNCKCTIM